MSGMKVEPSVAKAKTLDELLGAYEEDLSIPNAEDLDAAVSAKMAQEINLLKQASSQQFDIALKSELSLQHGESIDQAMDTESCMSIMSQIKQQKEREIEAVKESDPRHDTKIKEIEKRARQTLYKAMKKMNAHNERIPAKSKAAIQRRQSQQK